MLMEQRNVAFLGTTIAHGARVVLSMAAGATFVQIFWESLRSRNHSIQDIDAFINAEALHFTLRLSEWQPRPTRYSSFPVSPPQWL